MRAGVSDFSRDSGIEFCGCVVVESGVVVRILPGAAVGADLRVSPVLLEWQLVVGRGEAGSFVPIENQVVRRLS